MCCRGGGGPTVQEISLKNTNFLCLPLGNMSFWQVQCLGTRTIEQCRFHAIESKHSNLFCSRYSNSKDSRGEASTLLFSLFSLLMQIATLCRSLTLCLIFNKVRGTLVRIATQSLCERDHSFQSLGCSWLKTFQQILQELQKLPFIDYGRSDISLLPSQMIFLLYSGTSALINQRSS